MSGRLWLTVVGVVVLAGCGGTTETARRPAPSVTTTATASVTAPTPSAVDEPHATKDPAKTSISKVLVFVVENHSMAQVQQGMPNLANLARRYSYSTNFYAITHPSLPNYLAMAFGSTMGVTDDKPPAGHRLDAPTVFTQAIASGRTAGTFADSMTEACSTRNNAAYVARHNPWTYAANDAVSCQQFDQPIETLDASVSTGSLPNVGLVIPDQDHNGHDGSLADADAWIGDKIDLVQSGPDWEAGKLAIVVTADEDDKKSGNHILTAVLHPSLKSKVVSERLDLYSLSGLLSQVSHSPALLEAWTAPDMVAAFGLTIK